MGTKSDIQYAINILMEESGHKGSELADALGVSRSAVSNWMNGKNSIDIELVPRICDFFGITVDEFFGRSEVSHLTEEDTNLLIMSKLSNDSSNPMTFGFVYENRENCMNSGHFGGLRQKLGNDRALIMVGVFENSPPNKKEPRAPGIPWRAGLVGFGCRLA